MRVSSVPLHSGRGLSTHKKTLAPQVKLDNGDADAFARGKSSTFTITGVDVGENRNISLRLVRLCTCLLLVRAVRRWWQVCVCGLQFGFASCRGSTSS